MKISKVVLFLISFCSIAAYAFPTSQDCPAGYDCVQFQVTNKTDVVGQHEQPTSNVFPASISVAATGSTSWYQGFPACTSNSIGPGISVATFYFPNLGYCNFEMDATCNGYNWTITRDSQTCSTNNIQISGSNDTHVYTITK